MKILITGKNGYIAKSIYSELNKIYNITLIGRDDFNLLDFEQTRDYFANKYFDVIIHTAVSGGNRLVNETNYDIDINLQMYYSLLQNKKNYGKLISFGSGAELYNAESPYGLSKKIIAKSMRHYDDMFNIRIYAVFDENELDTRFIKSNIIRYINGEKLIIHQDKFMDFFYMKDLIQLCNYYILHDKPPKEIDCTYPSSYKLSDIANIINHLSDHRSKIIIDNEIDSTNYTGKYTELQIKYIGLYRGIFNTYENIRRKPK